MSNQAKPYEELSEFNRDNFPSSSSSASSLDYPVAQGVQSMIYGVIWGDGSYQNSASGGGGAPLTVQDGTVTVNNVTDINVTNGTLTDNGGGSVSITTGGGGSGVTNPMTADLDAGGYSIFNLPEINDCYAMTYHQMGPVTPGPDYIVAGISSPADAEGSIYFVARCLDPGFKQTLVCQVIGFQNRGNIRIINHVVESDTPIFTTVKYGTDGATNFIVLTCGAPSLTWENRVYQNEDDKGTTTPYGSSFEPATGATAVVLSTVYDELPLTSKVSGSSGSVFVKDTVTSNTVTASTGNLNTLNVDQIDPLTSSVLGISGNVSIISNALCYTATATTGTTISTDQFIGINANDSANIFLNVNANLVSTAGQVRVTGGDMVFAPNLGQPSPRIRDIGDPVDAQDAATKNYVDTTLGGYVTNPMTSDLDGAAFDINNVAILNETTDTQIGPQPLGTSTVSTRIYGDINYRFFKSQAADIPTDVNGNAGTMLSMTATPKSSGAADFGNVMALNLGATSTGGGLSQVSNLYLESSHEYHRMRTYGEMLFITNPTLSPGPSLQNTYDSCIKIQRASNAVPAPVINNAHFCWSEAGTTFGSPAYDHLCYGSSSQAINPSTDTPALIIDTFQKRVGVGVFPTEDFEVDGNMQIDSSSGTNSIKFYDTAGAHDHAQITAEDDGTNGGLFKIKTKEDGGALRDGLIIGQDLSVTIPGVPSAASLTTDATGKIIAGGSSSYTDAQAVNAVQTCATNPQPLLSLACGFAFSPPVLAPAGSPPPMYVIPPNVSIVHAFGGQAQITMPASVPSGTVIVLRNENNIDLEVFPNTGQVIENYARGVPGTPSYVAPSLIGNFQSITYYLADLPGSGNTWYVLPRP